MAIETIKITPDYIIAKSPTSGSITYSAGTMPTTGTEFPSYLRSTYSSSTIDPNTGYDIYYNQVAPFPYPLLNYGNIWGPVITQTVGGSIFSLTAAPAAALNSTVTVINTNIIEAGTYVIVPTIWYIESGSANSLNTATGLYPTASQFYCEIANTSTSFYITKFTTNDGSVLWIGPTSATSVDSDTSQVSGGDIYAIKLNYGMQNPDSINPAVPASYSSTYIKSTLSTVTITGTSGQFSCASTPLAVGETLTISGTKGGTGTITGYTSPKSYLISETNGSTTFTLKNLNNTAIATTAGTPTGLTYSKPKTLVIKLTTGSILSVDPAWTKGAVKILYYSRGYLKLRYTK